MNDVSDINWNIIFEVTIPVIVGAMLAAFIVFQMAGCERFRIEKNYYLKNETLPYSG